MSSRFLSSSPNLSPFQTRMNTVTGDVETRYVKNIRIQKKFASPKKENLYTYAALGDFLGATSPLSPGHA